MIGRTYPPTAPYEVGREQIKAFAEAIGDPSAAYRDPDAARDLGHPDVIAPPTFPVVFTFTATQQVVDDPDLDIDYDRVVHGAQRFEFHRPIYAGDRLVCTVTIDEIKNLGKHRSITLRTEVSTESGEAVLTDWSTLVVRSVVA